MANKIWSVAHHYFSTMDLAKTFRDNVCGSPYGVDIERLEITDAIKESLDMYTHGPFVYQTTLTRLPNTKIKPEDFVVTFVGFSMDLTDERDIVFEIAKGVFSVISIAYTYKEAEFLGFASITDALLRGVYHNENNKLGYIKCYREDTQWEESAENYLR